MSVSIAPRVAGLLAVAAAGLVAGLATGRAELAVLAGPFVLFAAIGLILARDPVLEASTELHSERVLEGEQTGVSVVVRNGGARTAELELVLGHGAQVSVTPAGPVMLSLAAGQRLNLEIAVRPLRWGAHAVGPLVVRARDPLGVTRSSGRLGRQLILRAFPDEQRLRELVAPLRTQPFLGAHVARARGEGIEFADIRPFAPGDRARQINWRATARRDALQVTQRHPEHASDVVLLIDTFAEVRDSASGTLDAAVRAAASLARAHLARRDRVALVDFGGTLHWLEPAFGPRQLYRIVDALLSSEIVFSFAWRAVDSIPRRLLPTGALILAISPLLDERSIGLVTDLRRRGADLTVIEVSPVSRTVPGAAVSDALAYRLWGLQREALRARLQAQGIGVAVWEEDDTLGPALEGVNAFRRFARHALRS
jgi:uncharacterized protein (DUF58 family)